MGVVLASIIKFLRWLGRQVVVGWIAAQHSVWKVVSMVGGLSSLRCHVVGCRARMSHAYAAQVGTWCAAGCLL